MKITVQKIAPHPQGLVLGLRIQHEKAGWVRFATTVILRDELSVSERRWLLELLAEARNEVLDTEDELLPIDWG